MRVCINCVMDETDPNIKFDWNGLCNHCTNFYKNIKPVEITMLEMKINYLNYQIKLKMKIMGIWKVIIII